jgi:hypothetical protein
VARQLRPDTKLARLILESGKPAYVVAGEVGINYNRLLDYADGRIAMAPGHRIKLTRYFGTDPRSGDSNEANERTQTFERVEFDATVRGVRVGAGGDAVVTLEVGFLTGDCAAAWRLTDAEGIVVAAVGVDYLHGVKVAFSATVEDVRVKPGLGMDIRVRIPAVERDAGGALGLTSTRKRFTFSPR